MNDETSLSKANAAKHESEQTENNPVQSDDAPDPRIQVLLNQGHEILTRQLDPIMRETLKTQPEKLAEWDALMQEYAQIAAERESSAIASETVSAKEAEEARLAQEIRQRMDSISADLDRFIDRQGPDLEVDAALERNFAAMHELDAVMRQRCRDYPEQLAKWEETMEYLEEVETKYAIALEVDNAEREN